MLEKQSYENNWSVFTAENNASEFFVREHCSCECSENEVPIIYQDHLLYFSTDIPFATINKQDKVVVCNVAFQHFFRKLKVPILGESIFNIIPEDIYVEHDEVINNFIMKIRLEQCSDVLILENETHYYSVQAFYLDKGMLHITINDMSLDKQFERLLTYQRQIESVSHMAASIAHELRNPLTVIKGFLQLSKLTNNYTVYYDTILAELERMNGIIEDFLSVSRKHKERKCMQPQKFMESIIEIIKPECILHNVTFDFEIERTIKKLKVDEGMIKQVFLNLLRNSIEAFREQEKANAHFYIEGKMKDDEYEIIVGDNGPGMKIKVLDNIGRPFITTKELGTGIGLPLCKKIIEEHGGTFAVSSEINGGTKIQILLPFSGEEDDMIHESMD